jgi:hypothetical protein
MTTLIADFAAVPARFFRREAVASPGRPAARCTSSLQVGCCASHGPSGRGSVAYKAASDLGFEPDRLSALEKLPALDVEQIRAEVKLHC